MKSAGGRPTGIATEAAIIVGRGEMKQQQGKKAQATQVAAGKTKRKSKQQQSKPTGGWQKVDLDSVQVDGFEDGCAFELEELTDYQLHKTEGGGQMLVSR